MFVELNTIKLLLPEVALVLAASSIFVGGAFTKNRAYWVFAAILSYLLAGAVLTTVRTPWMTTPELTGPVTIDAMSLGLRWLALVMGLVFTLAAARLADPELAGEVLGSLMLVTVGIMLVASANELVLLFLGLELISIPTYVLLFLGRRDRASSEATMKYFFLSIFSSALLLYGLAMIYGISGTTVIAGNEEIPGIREKFAVLAGGSTNPLASLAPLALVLIVAGLGFKLAVAPLQFYAPDVYQGTTNLNAGLLAVAPKIAGVAGLVRLVLVAVPAAGAFGWQLALVLAVLTMSIGNVCALWQKNIRRLLAYSSIAHGGYLLIGLATAAALPAASGGIAAMLLYVAVYAAATMGSFTALAYLSSPQRELNDVEELAGLGRSHPLIGGSLAVFMFSLAGIPPLAGFWGKLTLFSSAIQTASQSAGPLSLWFAALAVIGVLNAAVAAAYYLRVVSVMYFQSEAPAAPPAGGYGALTATLACTALVVIGGAFPRAAIDSATAAEKALHSRSPAVVHSESGNAPRAVAAQVD